MMNRQQVATFLGWLNQLDARVETSPANVEIWERCIGKHDPNLVREVVLDYVSKNENAPRPSAIKKLCDESAAHAERLNRAISAPAYDPHKVSLAVFRECNPGVLLREYEAGRREQALAMGVPYVPLESPPAWCVGSGSMLKEQRTSLE